MELNKSSYYKERKWNDFNYYVSETLPEIKIIESPSYHEYRGEITTLYHSDYYDRLLPSAERVSGVKFKHDRYSKSHKGVLRGLHSDDKTWKMVSCIQGEIYLVVLDSRKYSTNYGKWESFIISPKTNIQVLIPPGFSNGHYVLKDDSIFYYKLAYEGEYNDVQQQETIRWNSEQFNIDWPTNNPIISKRDANGN
jgi:dTDP-4-dehydrorhamnose 3,5-epimerase